MPNSLSLSVVLVFVVVCCCGVDGRNEASKQAACFCVCVFFLLWRK
jgi:hypothetical protein